MVAAPSALLRSWYFYEERYGFFFVGLIFDRLLCNYFLVTYASLDVVVDQRSTPRLSRTRLRVQIRASSNVSFSMHNVLSKRPLPSSGTVIGWYDDDDA